MPAPRPVRCRFANTAAVPLGGICAIASALVFSYFTRGAKWRPASRTAHPRPVVAHYSPGENPQLARIGASAAAATWPPGRPAWIRRKTTPSASGEPGCAQNPVLFQIPGPFRPVANASASLPRLSASHLELANRTISTNRPVPVNRWFRSLPRLPREPSALGSGHLSVPFGCARPGFRRPVRDSGPVERGAKLSLHASSLTALSHLFIADGSGSPGPSRAAVPFPDLARVTAGHSFPSGYGPSRAVCLLHGGRRPRRWRRKLAPLAVRRPLSVSASLCSGSRCVFLHPETSHVCASGAADPTSDWSKTSGRGRCGVTNLRARAGMLLCLRAPRCCCEQSPGRDR